MHKYALKLTKYSEKGAPTSDVKFEFADTPQGLSEKKTQYDKMRYDKIETSFDEEGNTVTEVTPAAGNKMYKTEPMQAEFETISDWETFCEVNKVLR